MLMGMTNISVRLSHELKDTLQVFESEFWRSNRNDETDCTFTL